MVTWVSRTSEKRWIDAGLRNQFNLECQYWEDVLKRVVAKVKFLSERGLLFRGDTETFNSPNNDNYMGILKLIAQFDQFLREHIAHFGNAGGGKPSYLSSTICEEMMGDKVYQRLSTK